MIPPPVAGGAPAHPVAYVYLLQSQVDGTTYVGWTTDPVRRLVEHNAGQAPSTRRKQPWRLIGVEAHPTSESAKRYERALKRNHRMRRFFTKRLLNRAANGRPRRVGG